MRFSPAVRKVRLEVSVEQRLPCAKQSTSVKIRQNAKKKHQHSSVGKQIIDPKRDKTNKLRICGVLRPTSPTSIESGKKGVETFSVAFGLT